MNICKIWIWDITIKQFSIMTDQKRLFLVAHIYARLILDEYRGSYARAFQIGLIKAKRNLNY